MADPRSRHAAEDRAAQEKLVWRLYGLLERLTYLADAVADAQAQAEKRRLKALASSLAGLRKELVATSEGGWLSGEEQLREKIGLLYGAVNSYEGRPTQSQLELAGVLEEQLEEAERRAEAVREKNAKALAWMTKEEWEEKQAGT